MSCPTCNHTMQKITRHFWCPNCGTLRSEPGPGIEEMIERPAWMGRKAKAILCQALEEIRLPDKQPASRIVEGRIASMNDGSS